MASIRRGYSDDFTLKNNSVGIGTSTGQEALDVIDGAVKGQDLKVTGISSFTAYEGFLRSDQQIVENTTLSFDQGPSASLSGEIIVGTGVTVTIASVGLGTTMVGVGTHTIENTIDTTDATRAGGSEIECLKVYNTFTPPSGGTNQRPEAPKPGELYYNYDFKTIEFFDGYGWRQVDNTTRSGRAVFFGGYIGATGTNRTKSMDLITIPTLGNSVYFGDLESARNDTQGCSDGTRGLCAGGYYPARLTDTEYITLASAGNSIQFGDLDEARNTPGGCSSSTRGLFAGGFNDNAGAPSVLQIDYFQISTLGNALDFGDSATSRSVSGGIPSSTRAVWGAGTNRVGNPVTTTAVSMMDYSTFASKGNAVEFGNDILPRDTGNGCSSGTRGVFAGGYGSPAIYSSSSGKELARKMSYITIASTGNAIEFGELSAIRIYVGSDSTSTRGIWTGGSNYPAHYDDIEYIQFSSLGNTIDFGNLHSFKGYMTGSASDSHGGLGGF